MAKRRTITTIAPDVTHELDPRSGVNHYDLPGLSISVDGELALITLELPRELLPALLAVADHPGFRALLATRQLSQAA